MTEPPRADAPLLFPLPASRQDEAAKLLGRAFFDDPAYCYIFTNEARRPAQLTWVYGLIVGMNYPFGHTYGLSVGGAPLLAVSAWLPPGRNVSLLDMVRHGMLKAPIVAGWQAIKRMLDCFGYIEAERKRLMEGKAHWYLDQLGVEPEHQGQGYGRRALSLALERCETDLKVPSLLFTPKEKNVPFYQGSGFKVMSERQFGGAAAFRFWAMMKQP